MIVRATTDYAIRIMAFLAKSDKVVSSTEISENTGISQKYLIKVAAVLRDSGLISSQHGFNGGYALSRSADEITMWDIMKSIEPDFCAVSSSEVESEGDDLSDGTLVKMMFDEINTKLKEYFNALKLSDFNKQHLAINKRKE